MDGPQRVPHYGLLLAGVAGLPSSVVETARSITARITEKVIFQMTNRPSERTIHITQFEFHLEFVCWSFENFPWCASTSSIWLKHL